MAADHSNGDELMVSVRSVMGSDDESMVTDANKNDVMCSKVHASQWLCNLQHEVHGHASTCKHSTCIVGT